MKFPRYIVALSMVGTAAGAVVLYKDVTGGKKYTGKERIPGRTVIITGATSGIGKETAKELANRGARVIMACRNTELCESVRSSIVQETCNLNVHCSQLDLASLASVREFADKINSSERRVDVLINNAGLLRTSRDVTTDGLEIHLAVNYLGHFLLTNLLLDKLIESSPSRVINTVGVGYDRTKIDFHDFNVEKSDLRRSEAYNRSKLAVALFTLELAKRVEGKGVTVVGVHPPVAFTNLRDKLFRRGRWMKPFIKLSMKTPLQAAQTTIFAAVDQGVVNGNIYRQCEVAEVDSVALDNQVSSHLWLVSERWTRLR